MKVENLEKAIVLQEKLKRINDNIERAGKATIIIMTTDLTESVYTKELIHSEDRDKILGTVKPMFISMLKADRELLLKEIEDLD